MLDPNIEKFGGVLLNNDVISYHLVKLENDLLEKNLIKIIQPYSVVEIEYVTNTIGI